MIRQSLPPFLVAAAVFAAMPGVVSGAAAQGSARDDALQMIVVDVEGGGGTVFVTPNRKVVVIDSGYADDSDVTGGYPSAQRLVDAIRAAGGTRIDYLVTTHYHHDHVGGAAGIIRRIAVDRFVDYGDQFAGAAASVPASPHSAEALFRDYRALIGDGRRQIVKPGDRIHLDGLEMQVVSANGKVLDAPLPGAGAPVADCTDMAEMGSSPGDENGRSIGLVLSYGKTRIVSMGDLTWDREKDLFCPVDRIGKVDIYLASHHGTRGSGSPAMVNALQPIVTIMGNSATKGGDPERVNTIQSNPRHQALWMLHAARDTPDVNGDPNLIANPDTAPAADRAHNLRLRIRPAGDITVINERNGYNQTYRSGQPEG